LPVSRDRAEVVFTALLLVVIGLAVWTAQAWGIRARLFPWAIGIPLLVLLSALLVTLVARQVRAASAKSAGLAGQLAATEAPVVEPSAEAGGGGPTAEAGAEARARRRGLVLVGWLLGFLAAIWLLGFPVGGTLGTLAYLKLAARERWPISLSLTAGTAVFFLLMVRGLNTPFPAGTLFELLTPPG
jgi:tripartite tricarboxylate transporter TctB family protein